MTASEHNPEGNYCKQYKNFMQRRLGELTVLLNGNTINRLQCSIVYVPLFQLKQRLFQMKLAKKRIDKGYDKQVVLNG